MAAQAFSKELLNLALERLKHPPDGSATGDEIGAHEAHMDGFVRFFASSCSSEPDIHRILRAAIRAEDPATSRYAPALRFEIQRAMLPAEVPLVVSALDAHASGRACMYCIPPPGRACVAVHGLYECTEHGALQTEAMAVGHALYWGVVSDMLATGFGSGGDTAAAAAAAAATIPTSCMHIRSITVSGIDPGDHLGGEMLRARADCVVAGAEDAQVSQDIFIDQGPNTVANCHMAALPGDEACSWRLRGYVECHADDAIPPRVVMIAGERHVHEWHGSPHVTHGQPGNRPEALTSALGVGGD